MANYSLHLIIVAQISTHHALRYAFVTTYHKWELLLQCGDNFYCRIIGLYIGLVFVIGQFVRTLTSGSAYTIMFDELPNVDKIMKLCKDLYFVRENGELDLEEEIFAKLIFLYR